MTNFEEKFNKISPDERKILQILSIFWEQITAQEFSSLIKHLGLKTPAGNGYTSKYLSLFRNSLVKKGFLHNTNEYWGSGFQISSENLKEFLTREALEESWFAEVVEIIQTHFNLIEVSRWSYTGERYKFRLLRDYRLSLYRQNANKAVELFLKIAEKDLTDEASKIVLQIFSNPFQKEFLSRFDQKMQVAILPVLFEQAIENSESTAELWKFVREQKLDYALIQNYELDELIYKGKIKKAKKLIGKTPNTFQKMFAVATIALFEKDYETSINHCEAAIKLWKKTFGKRKGFPDNWQMFLYGLALFKTDEAKFYAFSEDFYDYSTKIHSDLPAFRAVRALEYFLKNNDDFAQIQANQMGSDSLSDKILGSIIAAIIPSLKMPGFANEFTARNEVLGYRWLALELNNLLALKEKPESSQAVQAREAADKLQKELGFEPIGNLIPPIEDWERVLKVFTLVAKSLGEKKETQAKVNETRVSWQLDFDYKEIQPVEQKYGKTGWTKGAKYRAQKIV